MYDPTVGRFLSEDPAEYAAGDLNLYRYCTNRPLSAVDPTGLDMVVNGQGGLFDHQEVTVDVRDKNGATIGTLSASFSAYGYGGYGQQRCWGYDVLIWSPSYFELKYRAKQSVKGGRTGKADRDNLAMDSILYAVGKNRVWLDAEIAKGNTAWRLNGANGWGWYNWFVHSCQDFVAQISRCYDPIEQWGP